MTDANDALLSGMPQTARGLLASPPHREKKLIELRLTWAALTPSQARMADALRLFVITWDPLELHVGRPTGFATVNTGDLGLELAVYLPIWSLFELAPERGGTVAAVLGAMGGSAVLIAAAHEDSVDSGRYPDLLIEQEAPDLLAEPVSGSELGPAVIQAVSVEWEDIGLGAITDIVQHAFGPVDLDRSPVELAASAAAHPGCAACQGRRFGFPADLSEATDRMCPPHRREAEAVTRRRHARANASNPDGWGALIAASERLDRPHLPNGLAGKLAGADESMYVVQPPEVLSRRAHLVVEAAEWFPDRADDFAIALGTEPDWPGLPDWLVNLAFDLGQAGLADEAVMVCDALTLVDPSGEVGYACDAAVAVAQAGRAEQARALVAANLARWPDSFVVLVDAGDALLALGDPDGAAAHFNAALRIADDDDDFEARHDATERLMRVNRARRRAEPGRGGSTGQRRQPRRKRSKAQRKRKKRH